MYPMKNLIWKTYLSKGRVIGAWPFVFLVPLCLSAFIACHTAPSPSTPSSEDSAALVRPLVVDSNLRIVNYPSQMDADTALLGDAVIGGTTCRSRLALYQRQGRASHLQVIGSVEEKWSLVVCGMLRARRVKDLTGLTVATAREDASSVLCDKILREAGVSPSRVYHPQINSLAVRLQMLTNNQVDAAMLPEPYATIAQRQGHRILKTLTDTTQTIVVARKDISDKRKEALLHLILPNS